jgi:7-cyano-7-deazaguanine synthase
MDAIADFRMPATRSGEAVAVLASGGFDSAVLLARMADRAARVVPLYVRFGLVWEEVELHYLTRFVEAVHRPEIQPVVVLDLPVADIYGEHWSLNGAGVPDAQSPDEAVFLPGRNLFLLLKGMLWCDRHGVGRVALGILKGNPFPDASPEFFERFEAVVHLGAASRVRIDRPLASLSKRDVLQIGNGLPLEWTFSCIRPAGALHCGDCNKCAERMRVFREAGLTDPTTYAKT